MIATSPTARMTATGERPGPTARSLIERDRRVMSPSLGREHPLVISYGRGCEVFDVDGHRYLDFVSGIAVNSTGHAHPQVTAAIHEAVDEFLHVSSDFYHERWVLLAEKLNELAPFEEPAQVFLGNSGTEAVEAAIKLARYHTGRSRFIGFLGGFHGRTLGSLGFTASKNVQRAGFSTIADVIHVPFPNEYRPVLARQPGEADMGETVVNYLEQVVFRNLVSPQDVAGDTGGADPGRGRLHCAAGQFLPALARAVRPARHPADRGRGAERDGAHGQVVGHRALGRGAGHRVYGQGHRQRHAVGRHHRPAQRDDVGAGRARQHVRREPGGVRGGAGDDRRAGERRPGERAGAGRVYAGRADGDDGAASEHG